MEVSKTQFKKNLVFLVFLDAVIISYMCYTYNKQPELKLVKSVKTELKPKLKLVKSELKPKLKLVKSEEKTIKPELNLVKTNTNNVLSDKDMGLFIEGIKHWEGFKHKKYKCVGGCITIGYGFTGEEIKGIKSITKSKASWLLEYKYLPKYIKQVERIVKVPLTPHQKFALVSFCYNLGENNLRQLVNGKSRLNSGNYKSIERILPLYRNANGKRRSGLVLRRAWEIKCWNGDITTEYSNQ